VYNDVPRDIVELYISDYTENANLHEHVVGESGWAGPVGRRTLRVDLFPPHGPFTQLNVGVGTFVYLTNVRVKFSPTGELEGSIFKDNKYPDKVCVSVQRYGALLEELWTRKTALVADGPKAEQKSKAAAKKARQRANKKERAQQGGPAEINEEILTSIETEQETALSKLAIEPKLNQNGMLQLV